MPRLDTAKVFDAIWHCWTLTGGNPSKNNRTLFKLYTLFVAIVVMIMGPLNLIAELFFIDDFEILMMRMSTSLEALCMALKAVCLYLFRGKLLEAMGYLSKLDQYAEENAADRNRMDQIQRNSIRLYQFIRIAYVTIWVMFVVHAALTGNTVVGGWFPFDWRSSTALYFIAMTYQTFYAFYLSYIAAGVDAFMIMCIYIFIGHTKCLVRRISSIGYPNGRGHRSPEQNYKELVKCIDYHRNNQQYLDSLGLLISRTFFVQITGTAIITSTMISAVALSENNITFVLKSLLYTITIMLPVLLSCYLTSYMTEESSYLTTAIYSCNWMDQDVKFRKTIILFMQRSQQPNEIIAGSMVSVSLPTFVRLIKMSYSLFTLFSSS